MAEISKITLPNGSVYDLKSNVANKFSSNRTIKLTGDVTGYASSNGESGWSIATTVGNDSHSHTPDTLYIPSDFGKTGSLDLISGSKVGSYMSNKSFAIPPEAVTIEYSTDNGSTWKDYGATDFHKKGLFSETRYGCNTHLGKATTKEANSVNNQLRITISRINLGRYCAVDSFYTWMTTNGNTVYCKLEYSTNSNPTTFQTIFTDFRLAGWSGHNIKYFSEKELGGSDNGQVYAYRLTVWQTAINTDYPSADLYDIRFFGRNTYRYDAPYYKLQTNELYTWDNDLNATFPAKITATQFNGNATSASKLNSTRSFTIGKTAKNVDWSGAVSFSQAEISDNASTSAAGWMSKDDKTKLNGIETGAQVNTITGVKGGSESSYRTGNVNITAKNIGLGNLTNNKQVKGLSSGTTNNHLVAWGSDGYTVADSGIAKGSVATKLALSGTNYSVSSNTITVTKANLQSAVQDSSLVLMTAAERTKLASIDTSGNYVTVGGTQTVTGAKTFSALTSFTDSVTMGYGLSATGSNSVAMGAGSTASGDYAHAEGRNTIASGEGAHAQGVYSEASGEGAHAQGWLTSAIGDYSHASGLGTFATSDYQTVIGQYNIRSVDNSGDEPVFDAGDHAFVIGNGTITNRSNAFQVEWDGRVVSFNNFSINTPPSTDSWVTHYGLGDSAGNIYGRVQGNFNANGTVGITLQSNRTINNTYYQNNLNLNIKSDGSPLVQVAHPEAWRQALGVNIKTYSVTLTTNQYGEITLPTTVSGKTILLVKANAYNYGVFLNTRLRVYNVEGTNPVVAANKSVPLVFVYID